MGSILIQFLKFNINLNIAEFWILSRSLSFEVRSRLRQIVTYIQSFTNQSPGRTLIESNDTLILMTKIKANYNLVIGIEIYVLKNLSALLLNFLH